MSKWDLNFCFLAGSCVHCTRVKFESLPVLKSSSALHFCLLLILSYFLIKCMAHSRLSSESQSESESQNGESGLDGYTIYASVSEVHYLTEEPCCCFPAEPSQECRIERGQSPASRLRLGCHRCNWVQFILFANDFTILRFYDIG